MVVALLAPWALALAALLVVMGASPASAHATLVTTDPAEGAVLDASPGVITFTFDEAGALPADGVQVFDAEGEPVDSTSRSRDAEIATQIPDNLDDGTYVVVWRATSPDGHPIAGSLSFSIGAPSLVVAAPQLDVDAAGTSTDLSIARAVAYLGLLVSAGLILFTAWALRGVRLDDAVRRRLRRLATMAAVVAGAGALLVVPLAGAYRQGLTLAELDRAWQWEFIRDDVAVAALTVVGLTVGLLAAARPRIAGAGAALAALSPVLVGHSRTIEPVLLVAVTDVLHLVAGAVWFGGLVGLVVVLPALRGRERDAARVLARFSTVAATALGVLAVSGALMGWRILEGWRPLVDTGYGRLLLVKVAIAAVVALIAGWNRFVVLPGATAGVGHDARRRGVDRVRAVVRVEAVLLTVLVGVTGFLVNQSPREAPAVRETVPSRVVAAELGTARSLATIAPGVRGPNVISVQIQDEQGEPLDGFAAPVLSLEAADGSVDLGTLPVTPIGAGTYEADVVIPTSGTWALQVSLRASEFDNPVTLLTLEVR
ncbi:copper resistance protein CopC [Nocardioides sp. R-C-SC26]|uniref:copper resistance CopC/CopD family protein n=1 Tax=Nocardioides sp. R-C-SC26 TaxID=2870414 RepID=UPI001E5A3C81|nr:copper resistance protein CopC [Nocardioides sp. R-C-SC26]